MRMGVIIFESKILKAEMVNVFDQRVQSHHRERPGFTLKLYPDLIKMVLINMSIPKSMDEFTRFQACYLGYHHQQKCIGCNIERDTYEDVSTSLIQLTGEPVLGNIELEENVTGG